MTHLQTTSLQPPSPGNVGPCLIVSAHGGRILAADEASARLIGYSVEELTSLRLGDLVGRREYPQVMGFLEQSLLSGGGELEGVHLYCRDDSSRSVTLTVEVGMGLGPLPVGSALARASLHTPSTLHCFLKDVTEQERIGQELQQRKQALSSLHTLADTVGQAPRLAQVLGDALSEIVQMLALEMGGIYVAEQRDGDGPFVLQAVQGVRPGLVESPARLSAEGHLLQRLIAEVQRDPPHGSRSTPVLIRERLLPAADLLPSPWREAGMRAFMALLLGTQQKPCGLLLVGATRPHHFDSRDRDLLELSSHQLSMAVENGLLVQELTQHIRDLSAMRQFSASVLRDMSDGLLTVDAERRITTFNPAAEAILGYRASTVEGRSLAALLGGDSEVVALVREAVGEGTSHARRELVVRRGDGRPVPVGASVALLRTRPAGLQPSTGDEDGRVTGAVVVFTDLTEQKNAEEERRHQDRLALLGEMTAVLAHEVRNPLAGIVHGIQYLAEELSPEGEVAQYARLILEDSRRISRLLDDILLISRPQQLELIPCDLQAIIEGLLHQWRAQAAARGVDVRTSFAENLSLPLGDSVRLEQVLANLVGNALDAMPDGGTLWLRVGPTQLAPSLPGQTPCSAVRVEVEDTGVGIPAHSLQRVFEPFFTTRQNGTGLGLAIARRIVRDHQGRVEVQSEEGKGTLFTVTLPLGEPECHQPLVPV